MDIWLAKEAAATNIVSIVSTSAPKRLIINMLVISKILLKET
jgi:hypothetical protein